MDTLPAPVTPPVTAPAKVKEDGTEVAPLPTKTPTAPASETADLDAKVASACAGVPEDGSSGSASKAMIARNSSYESCMDSAGSQFKPKPMAANATQLQVDANAQLAEQKAAAEKACARSKSSAEGSDALAADEAGAKKKDCDKAKYDRDQAILAGLPAKAKKWVLETNDVTGTTAEITATNCAQALFESEHDTIEKKKNPAPSIRDTKGACDKAVAVLGAGKSKESAKATSADDAKFKADECADAVRAAMREGQSGCDTPDNCAKLHGCTADISTIKTTEVVSQVTTQGVQLVAQTTGAIAQMNVQASAQAAATGANGKTNDDVHRDALTAMATAQTEAAGAQLAGATTLTVTAAVEAYTASVQSDSVKKISAKMDVLLKHNDLVKDYIADPSRENYELVHNDYKDNMGTLGTNPNMINQESSAKSADPALMQFDEGRIRAALGTKKALADKASGLALQHGVQAGVLAAGGALNLAQASMLRDQRDAMGSGDITTSGAPEFHAIVAGGPNGALVDTSAPPGGITQTLGDGAAATAAEAAQDTTKAPVGAIPPPLFGGAANPGGLKDASPGVSGGLAGTGSSSGGGGSAGGGSGSGGGSDSGGGADKAGDEAVGSKTKFEGAASGAGGFASNSSGTRDKNTGMSADGILAGLLGAKGDDRKPASDIVNFGKNGAAAKAQAKSDEEEGILGKNTNLFTRVSKTTVSYYKTGKLK